MRRAFVDARRGRGALLLLLVGLCGCERGCARAWFDQHGMGETARPGPGPMMNAIDCPDGLARCVDGVVEVSRLATLPQPCSGSAEACECPWQRAGDCERACVVEGATLVVERGSAVRQLCAPLPEAGSHVVPVLQPAPDCDEDVLYRCAAGAVTACAQHAVVARCEAGCAVEGSEIGDDVAIDREGAFAILCSR